MLRNLCEIVLSLRFLIVRNFVKYESNSKDNALCHCDIVFAKYIAVLHF